MVVAVVVGVVGFEETEEKTRELSMHYMPNKLRCNTVEPARTHMSMWLTVKASHVDSVTDFPSLSHSLSSL